MCFCFVNFFIPYSKMNEIEIEKICRTCLKQNENMENLFDLPFFTILTTNFGLTVSFKYLKFIEYL